jgi:ankyrin repeat protein
MRTDDINQVDKNGQSVLHFAAHSGNIETVRFLLQLYGINPLVPSIVGRYPSEVAKQFGHAEVSRILEDAELAAFRSRTNP